MSTELNVGTEADFETLKKGFEEAAFTGTEAKTGQKPSRQRY